MILLDNKLSDASATSTSEGDVDAVGSHHLPLDNARTASHAEAQRAGSTSDAKVQLRGTGANGAAAARATAVRAARSESAVQLAGPGGGAVQDEAGIQDVAAQGVMGASRALPHLETIQRSFGKHDVGGVRAHTDTTAAQANASIGADAYTRGSDVVFAGGSPDLHLAAHEAAHVVQQRGGVQLKGGVGQGADQYEAHADAVADAVVRGDSAESLLDEHAGEGRQSTASEPAVQGRFSTVRRHLRASSGTRDSNAAYLQILADLQAGAALQAQDPSSVALCDQMLAVIAQIEGNMAAAASTKWFKKGRDRNAAITALGVSIAAEKAAITRRRARYKRRAVRAVNGPGLGHAPNMVGLGGDQGASGSYFDRAPHGGAIRGIFKPESQEGGARAGRDARGQGSINEVVGDSLDQHLGLGVVPRTRLAAIDSPAFAPGAQANIPGSGDSMQVGSYQQAVPNLDNNKDLTSYFGDGAAHRGFDANSLQKIAILDMLTLNRDRHGENVMIQNDGKLAAIDQGEVAPSAMAFTQKFKGDTTEAGWAWADLPESEQAWSVANKQLIETMDPEAEVDHMAQTARTESAKMAAVTGADPAETHLSDRSIAMMKYSGRCLQLCTKAGLSPAQIESVYKKRVGDRAAVNVGHNLKKVAKTEGGGEFAQFISETFQQDEISAQIAQATGAPVPAPVWHYNDPATEDRFHIMIAQALGRFAVAEPGKRAGIGQVMSDVMPPLAGPAQPAVTAVSSVAEAQRLWAHVEPGTTAAVSDRGLNERTVLDKLWESGSPATRQRMLAVLNVQGDQLRMSKLHYILEAIDPTHRMNLPSKVADWFLSPQNGTCFFTWVAQVANVPDAGPTADYLQGGARAQTKVQVNAGKLQQGLAPADMNTGGGDGWTVVLSGADFFSKPKSGHDDDVKTQHSSFMAGLPVDAAAMMRVNGGTLEMMNNYSGHYAPTIPSMVKILLSLMRLGVPLAEVRIKDIHGLAKKVPKLEFNALEYLGLAKQHMRG